MAIDSANRARLVRFALTGGGTAALFFGLLMVFMTAGLQPFWSGLLAYGVAFLIGYSAQRGWTFGSNHRHAYALPRYLILQLGCAVLSATTAEFVTHLFGLSPMATSLIATGLTAPVSYLGSSVWVFSESSRETSVHPSK